MDSTLEALFARMEELTESKESDTFDALMKNKTLTRDNALPIRPLQWLYIEKIITVVNELADLIRDNTSILISVKNQKLLRTCFQLIISLGLLPCLIPGVGISLNKRSEMATKIPPMKLDDIDKHKLLKQCTDFFIGCYCIPILKNIILTGHLADYLAALIQLSYAPLKKPGNHNGFTMTEEMYLEFEADKKHYCPIFKNLVSTCFQPMIMKQLLVLQSVTDPAPPKFLKVVTARELSERLLAPGGLLSLIRCFIESTYMDIGEEWKKIDMIRKIVGGKHGVSGDECIRNFSKQLKEIISSTNTHYYTTAANCIMYLREQNPGNSDLETVANEFIVKSFDVNYLEKRECPPGSIILTSQEIEHKVNILHSLCTIRLTEFRGLMSCNLLVLFLLRLKCTKSEDMRNKLTDLIIKHLEEAAEQSIKNDIKKLLYGDEHKVMLSVEEYDVGMVIKMSSKAMEHPTHEAASYLIEHLKQSATLKISVSVFEACLEQLLSLAKARIEIDNHTLMELEDKGELCNRIEVIYASTLHLLEQLCTAPKVLSASMKNPDVIFKFIEDILLGKNFEEHDECITVALVFLNTLLIESTTNVKARCLRMVPVLHKFSSKESENGFLATEILALITNEKTCTSKKSEFAAVESDIFDSMIPVRAHGLMELKKLIEKKDQETLSKKHYVMCLFQENLKDEDSYIYQSAIYGVAALGLHCPEDVLNVLCREYLECSSEAELDTQEAREKRAKLRMKVGDVIVKLTRGLGEMAVAHKALLLNTVLSACGDDDPLIRASALSNLAEITLVLNYRVGTILYEILVLICNTLETDKSPECRRAAVMVISSLLKGTGKDTLLQLQDTLLPLYRTLKRLYNQDEDSVVKLHAQIALEELDDIVKDFLHQKVEMQRKMVFGKDEMDIKFK